MRKVLLAIPIILVTLFLLAIAAMAVLETRWFSNYLSERLSERFERQVEWSGSLHIDWSWHPTLWVEQLRVGNAHWAEHDTMVRAQKVTVRLDLTQILDGLLAVERLKLAQPVVHLAQSKKYGANWQPFIPKKKDKEPLLQPTFGRITLDDGKLTYKAPARQRHVAVQNLEADLRLNAGQLSMQRIRFEVGGGTVKLSGTVDTGQEIPQGQLVLQVDSVDLAQMGYAEFGRVDGRITLLLQDQALLLGNSELTYREPANNIKLEANIEPRSALEDAPGMRVTVSGNLRGKSLGLQLLSGPLLDLNDPRAAYPLNLNLVLDNTQIDISGVVTQLLFLKDMKLWVQATGPDPAILWYLTGIGFLHLPPYHLRGRLVRDDTSWYLRDIKAQIGNSDLAGNMRLDIQKSGRPMLWADLHSQHFDLGNFLSLMGSPESPQPPQNASGEGSMLERLKAMDARIEFDSEYLLAKGIPLDELHLEARLEEGMLRLEPLRFGIGKGTVKFLLTVDVASVPVEGMGQVEINRVNLNALLASIEMANQSRGIIGGQGQFWFVGHSMDEALASLDGHLSLLMDSGRLDALVVEAMGLDFGEALLSVLGDNAGTVVIQCAYTGLKADDGLVDIKPLIIATSDSNIKGRGHINLRRGRFELILEAHPKDFSLFTASSPIRIYGTFENPQVDVVSGELIRAGLLTLLGAAIFPPAALLGLVEAGDTEGLSGCRKMIASVEY